MNAPFQETMFDHFADTAGVRVLVACEYSGTVRNAFLARGFDAWSCDLLPSEDRSNRHITGDARDLLGDGWDLLMVAHPPCTRLCNSGVRWIDDPSAMKNPGEDFTADERAAWPFMDLAARRALMQVKLDQGAELFSTFWNAPIERICVENPVMHRHAKERIRNYRPPAQSVQPWQFGHGETKRTCFWLKNLPPLKPTDIVEGREARVHLASPGPDRWKERSRFFPGIAAAMADQWAGSIN